MTGELDLPTAKLLIEILTVVGAVLLLTVFILVMVLMSVVEDRKEAKQPDQGLALRLFVHEVEHRIDRLVAQAEYHIGQVAAEQRGMPGVDRDWPVS